LDDIIHDEAGGLWYLGINARDDKRLKSESSWRKIPLHDFLIREMHLPTIIKGLKAAGFSRLFEMLKPLNQRKAKGQLVSTWFTEYRRSLEVGTTAEEGRGALNFHSFRHTFSHALIRGEAQADSRMVQAIMGHSPGKDMAMTEGVYAGAYDDLGLLKRGTIDRLNFQAPERANLKAALQGNPFIPAGADDTQGTWLRLWFPEATQTKLTRKRALFERREAGRARKAA